MSEKTDVESAKNLLCNIIPWVSGININERVSKLEIGRGEPEK
jgi:hypothetical protein